MKRFLMAVAIAGMVLGCGDDDDTTPAGDGGADAGRDGGMDASTDAGGGDAGGDAGTVVKVNNLFASCTTANAATTCGGASPICQTALPLGPTPYPNGPVCTAECTKDGECGTGGICPVGVAIAQVPAAAANLGGKGYCTKPCTLTNQASCGAGYACVSIYVLAQGTPAAAQVPNVAPWNTPFCTPRPATDGGVGDAGTDAGAVTDAGGMDAATP